MLHVRDVMSSDITTATPEMPFKDIWKSIFKKHINAMPVVDSKKRLLGILTKEDILKTLFPDYGEFIKDLALAEDPEDLALDIDKVFGRKVKEVMCRNVIFAHEDTILVRALARMMAHRIGQMPVVSEDLKVVGMITKGDIFYALYGAGKNIVTLGKVKKPSKSAK